MCNFARHGELAAHQAHQALRNREAQPRAAVAACHRRVGLREFLEHGLQMFRRDPDAGVPHAESQRDGAVARMRRRHGNHDFPLLGELDRVADQVHEHLAQARRIPAHRARGFGCHVREQLEVLFARPHREQTGRRMDDFGDVKRNRFELEMLGLDLRVVEDVVEDHQQRFRG